MKSRAGPNPRIDFLALATSMPPDWLARPSSTQTLGLLMSAPVASALTIALCAVVIWIARIQMENCGSVRFTKSDFSAIES
jgi:hypothetical protein